jgi:hypothetical protein
MFQSSIYRSAHRFKGTQLQQLLPELVRLKKLSLDSCNNKISKDELSTIITLLPVHLEYIDLHDDHALSARCHECMEQHLPALQDRHLVALAERCVSLKHANLDSCSNFTPEALRSLVSSCSSLITLCIHSHKIGYPEIKTIFDYSKSLQHLSVVSPLLSEHDSYDEHDEYLDEPRSRFRPRPRQSLESRTYMQAFPFRSSSPIASLSNACPPSLRSLKLFTAPHKSVPWESDKLAPFLRATGSQLKALIAHRCFNAAWQRISVLCPNLSCLDLSHGSLTYNLLEVIFLIPLLLCLHLISKFHSHLYESCEIINR